MSEWAAKRFWEKTEAGETDGGFTVRLDGRPIRTPAKTPIAMPTKAMAEAVAAEWDAQDGRIDPLKMPVTRAVNAAIDKVTPQKREVADMLAEYAESDLLCYRATQPAELTQRQQAQWAPVLDWLTDRFDAPLNTTEGMMHIAQPANSIAALGKQVHELDPFELAGFHDLVTITGSFALGLAALYDQWPMQDIWNMSRIDEHWQQEQWGVDEEAAEQEAAKREAFFLARNFVALARGEST